MARVINAGEEKVGRGDLFFVDPFGIVLNEELRGRHKPPEESEIIKLAVSLMDDQQQQPCKARKIEDNKIQLVSGFTRCAAARLIRTGFTAPDGVKRLDKEFKLQVTVTTCNDQEAFMANVAENAIRTNPSPIDDAFNQRRMRDSYGMSDVEIAIKYGYTNSNKVNRLKQLLGLEPELQDMVHDGRLPVNAALDLLDAPADKRAEIIAGSIQENGRVNGVEVRKQVRQFHLNDDPRPASEDDNDQDLTEEDRIFGEGTDSLQPKYAPVKSSTNGAAKSSTNGSAAKKGTTAPAAAANGDNKSKPLTMRELRNFWEGVRDGDEVDPAVAEFCKSVIMHMGGKKGDKAMMNAIEKLLEAKPAKRAKAAAK